jgi:hypothetical protein
MIPDPFFFDINTGKYYELIYDSNGNPENFYMDNDGAVIMKEDAKPLDFLFPDSLELIPDMTSEGGGAEEQPNEDKTEEPKKKRGRPKKSS